MCFMTACLPVPSLVRLWWWIPGLGWPRCVQAGAGQPSPGGAMRWSESPHQDPVDPLMFGAVKGQQGLSGGQTTKGTVAVVFLVVAVCV